MGSELNNKTINISKLIERVDKANKKGVLSNLKSELIQDPQTGELEIVLNETGEIGKIERDYDLDSFVILNEQADTKKSQTADVSFSRAGLNTEWSLAELRKLDKLVKKVFADYDLSEAEKKELRGFAKKYNLNIGTTVKYIENGKEKKAVLQTFVAKRDKSNKAIDDNWLIEVPVPDDVPIAPKYWREGMFYHGSTFEIKSNPKEKRLSINAVNKSEAIRLKIEKKGEKIHIYEYRSKLNGTGARKLKPSLIAEFNAKDYYFIKVDASDQDDRIDLRKSGLTTVVNARAGDDRVWGDLKKSNYIEAGAGDDEITGGLAGDALYGNAGDDKIDSGLSVTKYGTISTGRDWINAGDGDDQISIGLGAYIAFGGKGNDRFSIKALGRSYHGDGNTRGFVDAGLGDDQVSFDSDLKSFGLSKKIKADIKKQHYLYGSSAYINLGPGENRLNILSADADYHLLDFDSSADQLSVFAKPIPQKDKKFFYEGHWMNSFVIKQGSQSAAIASSVVNPHFFSNKVRSDAAIFSLILKEYVGIPKLKPKVPKIPKFSFSKAAQWQNAVNRRQQSYSPSAQSQNAQFLLKPKKRLEKRKFNLKTLTSSFDYIEKTTKAKAAIEKSINDGKDYRVSLELLDKYAKQYGAVDAEQKYVHKHAKKLLKSALTDATDDYQKNNSAAKLVDLVTDLRQYEAVKPFSIYEWEDLFVAVKNSLQKAIKNEQEFGFERDKNQSLLDLANALDKLYSGTSLPEHRIVDRFVRAAQTEAHKERIAAAKAEFDKNHNLGFAELIGELRNFKNIIWRLGGGSQIQRAELKKYFIKERAYMLTQLENALDTKKAGAAEYLLLLDAHNDGDLFIAEEANAVKAKVIAKFKKEINTLFEQEKSGLKFDKTLKLLNLYRQRFNRPGAEFADIKFVSDTENKIKNVKEAKK